MKCLECEDAKAEYDDPRDPPLGLNECLCPDCALAAWQDVLAEAEDRVSEAKDTIKEIEEARKKKEKKSLGVLAHIKKENEDRAKAKKEIMAAARHLSPSRMAWVVSQWTTGVDWSGSTKGSMADTLSYDRYKHSACQGGEGVVAADKLARICAFLRAQPNPHGTTALRPTDLPIINARVAVLKAKRSRSHAEHKLLGELKDAVKAAKG